ncbi:hypothetical protein WMY93_031104 [Mugilogobius chulae]|uniref:Uncharacterized protein n=1 Tax=Mugilogobius chulae TaxID=88201 RepID=A0AAW0MEX3_9GOBI
MAVATKNSSGVPFRKSLSRSDCPRPTVHILKYDVFLEYLVAELDVSLASEALIECLAKHRELIWGDRVWSPRRRAYARFNECAHGAFSVLKTAPWHGCNFLGKLLPVYCRLCFLAQCHEQAAGAARAVLGRISELPGDTFASSGFEIRTLEYVIENLSANTPAEWGQVFSSPDVATDAKVAVELLWCHLVLLYAGNRRLLLFNLEVFFSRSQDLKRLCPEELRDALFVHGKRDSVIARRGPRARFDACPAATRDGVRGEARARRVVTGTHCTGSTSPRRSQSDRTRTDETLRATGNCVVRLGDNVLLHVVHVNTVGNQKFSAAVFSEDLRKRSLIQSNTTKTKLLSRLKFISDKKVLSSRHGYKNTRIEFSSKAVRSANYTSNAKLSLQTYFRAVFETVSLTQGTCVVAAKPLHVNNVNYTSYLYGVANPASVCIRGRSTAQDFQRPFFFSSVNVLGKESKHQLFTSMAINSQKVTSPGLELPAALVNVTQLVEMHVHLNRLCCELALERRGALTTREKVCLVYLTESYFAQVTDRSHPKHWSGYVDAVRRAFCKAYRSELSSFQDKALMNYHVKNPEFVHLVPWLLDHRNAEHDAMLLGHEAYLRSEGKVHARAELIARVEKHAKMTEGCRIPLVDAESVLKVWDVVNRDFERILDSAGLSDAKRAARVNVESHVAELRELMNSCSARLSGIEACISELQGFLGAPSQGERGRRDNCAITALLQGEWHFLFTEDSRVFGYMMLIPGSETTVSEFAQNGPVKTAKFTLPSGLFATARDVRAARAVHGETTRCPCCKNFIEASVYWKHALFEIINRGNSVPARQSLDRSVSCRWVVDSQAGWTYPIYKPRDLENAHGIGESLAELKVKPIFSEYAFSQSLDIALKRLTLRLRP